MLEDEEVEDTLKCKVDGEDGKTKKWRKREDVI